MNYWFLFLSISLISQMIVKSASNRISVQQVADHAWLRLNRLDTPVDNPAIKSYKDVDQVDHDFIIKTMLDGQVATLPELVR